VDKKIFLLVYGRFPTEKAYGIHAVNQAKSFSDLGYEVILCYPATNNIMTINKSPEDYYEKKFNFHVNKVEFRDITSSKYFKYLPDTLKKILWLIRSYQWSKLLKKDIVNGVVWATNPISLYPHRKSNNLIFEQHGQAKYIQRFFIYLLKKHNSIFVGTTKYSYINLKKINRNSILLPNAVDTELFKPKNTSVTSNLVVGYAGMLETYDVDKGVFKSVEAILSLLEEINFNIVIIGGPENKLHEIRKLVAKSKYKNNFTFKDRMSQSNLANEISNFDIGLVPYPKNTHMNKFASPLKIFEYLASGVVCLASDLESHTDIKFEGMNYFKNGDFNDFKKELKSLLSNPESLKEQKFLLEEQVYKLSINKRSEQLIDFLRP
jgi:glycosyltransferase involved in cell wall biosynthesis